MYFNWNGCRVEEFEFEGRTCFVAIPESPTGDWVFKTEYWGAFPDVERELVENHGFYAFAIRHATRLSPVADLECEGRFMSFMTEKYSLKKKGALVGMSLGGASAVKFSGRFPDRVGCMWLDAPVMNLTMYPTRCADEYKKAFPDIKLHQIYGADIHPSCCIDTLIENKIPVFMSYGKEDQTVFYSEHGYLLETAYEKCPELLTVVPVGLRGHHPHSLMSDNTPVVEFILNNTKE